MYKVVLYTKLIYPAGKLGFNTYAYLRRIIQLPFVPCAGLTIIDGNIEVTITEVSWSVQLNQFTIETVPAEAVKEDCGETLEWLISIGWMEF